MYLLSFLKRYSNHIIENPAKYQNCIIFISEIGSLTQSGERDMHETIRCILSVFWGILDEFETSDDEIVI